MYMFFIVTFLLINLANYSFAQVVGIRLPSCDYLSGKGIYCFGGKTSERSLPATSIYFLDINNNNGTSTNELATKWTTIQSNENNIYVQPMDRPQSMLLGDGATMLISGGEDSNSMSKASMTVGYNADNNSWIVYPDFDQPPFAARQIFRAASVYVPEYGVGFYGGREDNPDQSWTNGGQNLTGYIVANNIRYIGYTRLTFFDVRKSNPWYEFPIQNNLPPVFHESKTSIFDPVTNKIFYFGGGYYNVERTAFAYESIKAAYTFNLDSALWGTQALNGTAPSARALHTTTLCKVFVTSTNRDVLLYGGDFNENAASDYLFTLNLDNFAWKQHHISSVDAKDLIRSGHSAVLVNNTLFIIFGKNKLQEIVSTILLLNVTDPSRVTYLETYIDPNAKPVSNDTSEPNTETISDSESSSGLSTGAIVGIAVGSAIGGILIIAAIIFFLRKKRKNIRIEEPEAEVPEMENVNWEELEKNYEVIDNGSPNSHRSDLISGSTIAMKSNSPDNSITPMRPDVGTSIRPDLDINRSTEKPDIGL